jgi:UDPglucose 6-dehydrogenase
VGFTEWGHSLIGVDIDAQKIERLNRGEVPIHEPGLPELIAKAKASGLLSFA